MYTVKQAAGILGISVHTVRYYDDKGLIPGTKRNSANQRMFDDDELEWLFVSVTLSKTGLSLAEIKRYITLYQQGDATLAERYQIMQAQRERTLQEMEEMKRRLAVLNKKLEHYGKLLDGKKDTWDHAYMQNLIWKGKKKDDK